MLAANSALTELNLSGICEQYANGVVFAQELAVGIATSEVMVSVNILKNRIPVEQAQALVEIMRSKKPCTTQRDFASGSKSGWLRISFSFFKVCRTRLPMASFWWSLLG